MNDKKTWYTKKPVFWVLTNDKGEDCPHSHRSEKEALMCRYYTVMSTEPHENFARTVPNVDYVRYYGGKWVNFRKSP